MLKSKAWFGSNPRSPCSAPIFTNCSPLTRKKFFKHNILAAPEGFSCLGSTISLRGVELSVPAKSPADGVFRGKFANFQGGAVRPCPGHGEPSAPGRRPGKRGKSRASRRSAPPGRGSRSVPKGLEATSQGGPRPCTTCVRRPVYAFRQRPPCLPCGLLLRRWNGTTAARNGRLRPGWSRRRGSPLPWRS